MNVVGGVAGLVATLGLLVAWRARQGFAPLFFIVFAPLTLLAVVATLLRDVFAGALTIMLAVPYWGAWMLLYALGGAGMKPPKVPER